MNARPFFLLNSVNSSFNERAYLHVTRQNCSWNGGSCLRWWAWFNTAERTTHFQVEKAAGALFRRTARSTVFLLWSFFFQEISGRQCFSLLVISMWTWWFCSFALLVRLFFVAGEAHEELGICVWWSSRPAARQDNPFRESASWVGVVKARNLSKTRNQFSQYLLLLQCQFTLLMFHADYVLSTLAHSFTDSYFWMEPRYPLVSQQSPAPGRVAAVGPRKLRDDSISDDGRGYSFYNDVLAQWGQTEYFLEYFKRFWNQLQANPPIFSKFVFASTFPIYYNQAFFVFRADTAKDLERFSKPANIVRREQASNAQKRKTAAGHRSRREAATIFGKEQSSCQQVLARLFALFKFCEE